MRSLGERLHLLRKALINLRCGPGAAILPPEVSRIHLDFAARINGGHMGPRKFWRQYLPRLKYHNPSVPMIVNRHDVQTSEPMLTIYMRTNMEPGTPTPIITSATQPESSFTNFSKAPPPGPNERIIQINAKNMHSNAICDRLLAATNAIILKPTKEEAAEIKDLEDMRQKGLVDRERMRAIQAEKKKEQDMLKRARAAGGDEDDA
ncbi:putative ribosomal protein MRP49 [Stachybotrys elegans]|uniref:Ribosomal protein MRP49 n=1 Tax=Stachybotrys elegans TaxID=80388 RepID=A0A8K0SXX2_9HYPO|nr:putative ribosomal protein MRP49 [Stachybotrys elegans]